MIDDGVDNIVTTFYFQAAFKVRVLFDLDDGIGWVDDASPRFVKETHSEARLPGLFPEELDAAQRQLFDTIAETIKLNEDGRLPGPYATRLLEPVLGLAVHILSSACYAIPVERRFQEIAILEVAKSRKAEFMWFRHKVIASQAGLTNQEIEAINSGTDVDSFNDEDQLVRKIAQVLNTDADLPDDLFEQAIEVFGHAHFFDLMTTIGHHQHVALAMNVWRIPLPSEVAPNFA